MLCKGARRRRVKIWAAAAFRRGCPAKIRPERTAVTIFHPNSHSGTVGSGSVQPMLSNEAQRAKQTRIRTILAEFLAAAHGEK